MGSKAAEQKDQEPVLEPEVKEPEQEAPKYRFQILSDREAKWTEAKYWREFAIGHAWIRLIAPSGEVDSWGYWPDLENGHGVDTSAPWRSVPGRCRSPDTAHAPNAQYTYEIEEDAARKVTGEANDKVAQPGEYNLFTYNCTTFAVEMAQLAGIKPPEASTFGIKNPNSLYAGIASLNKKRNLDPMERELDAQSN